MANGTMPKSSDGHTAAPALWPIHSANAAVA
jgi:hypothetical protein